jgi:hypothetical protein
LPIDNEHVIDSVIVYFSFGWRPFSLTKYCAIFSKEKGYFCPITNNNQLGIGSGISCFRVASEFESRYNNPLEADNVEANESNEAEADEANEATAADEADAVEADEDDDANEADLANEANVEAISASTNDAVLDEAKADEANKANEADAVEAIVIDEIVAADEAIVIDEVIAVDETILDDAANEAFVVDAANEANEAFVADDADGAVLYSLTKYSAIFAEVKGYFGITAPDNQLGQRSSCSLRSKNRYQLDNQLEVVVEKGLV